MKNKRFLIIALAIVSYVAYKKLKSTQTVETSVLDTLDSAASGVDMDTLENPYWNPVV